MATDDEVPEIIEEDQAAEFGDAWATSAQALISSQQAATTHLSQATQIVEALRSQLKRTRGQLQKEQKLREEKVAALARAETRIRELLDQLSSLETRLKDIAAAHEAALEEERRRAAAELEAEMQKGLAYLKEIEALEEEWRRKFAAAIEAEVEKRIMHLQQVAAQRVSRMMQARAFGPWKEEWTVRRSRENMLRQAAARLMMPGLIATFKHWREDWHRENNRNFEDELKETKAQLKTLQELRAREKAEWERNSRGSLNQIFQLTEALKGMEARDREQDLIISQLAITQEQHRDTQHKILSRYQSKEGVQSPRFHAGNENQCHSP